MDAEKWLEENVLADDWSKLEEGLNDALWNNNVLEYMEQYAVYKATQKASSNSEYKRLCKQCFYYERCLTDGTVCEKWRNAFTTA